MTKCHELPDDQCHWHSTATGPTLAEKPVAVLPDDNATRNDFPMFDGLLAYFPKALAEVSRVSVIGNRQHNPGQPLHWARDKSTDHANKILRHLTDHGLTDKDGERHSARLAWRSLALLEEELEKAGGKPGRASRWANPNAGKMIEVPPGIDVRQFANIVMKPLYGPRPPDTLRGSVAEKMQADKESGVGPSGRRPFTGDYEL